MNDDLKTLKRDYQAIRAPQYLSTRIRASVDQEQAQPARWLPAVAATTIAVAAVAMFTLLYQPATVTAMKPSLSTLATLKPEKPAVPVPSLSKLRSVPVPHMPAKPRPKKPQSNRSDEPEFLKEKDHANV
jgi:hypothetical protein